MKSLFTLGVALLGLSNSIVNAAAIPAEHIQLAPFTSKRDALEERQNPATCTGNGPDSRNCWSQGFTSLTDMYTSWPNTGVVRSYDLSVANTTCNPDGAGARVCMLINGRFPGPTIVANWGDTIVSYQTST